VNRTALREATSTAFRCDEPHARSWGPTRRPVAEADSPKLGPGPRGEWGSAGALKKTPTCGNKYTSHIADNQARPQVPLIWSLRAAGLSRRRPP
jgi:hypothetical protein